MTSQKRSTRIVFEYDSDADDENGGTGKATNRSAIRRHRRRLQHRMDVNYQQTVGEIKEIVRHALRLPGDKSSASSESHDRQVLALSYAGALLDDLWRLSDVGIHCGSVVRLYFRSENKPSFILLRRVDNRSSPVYRPIDFRLATGADLRAIASRTSGLPVGSFRLMTSSSTGSKVDIYDCQTLDKYGLELGCTVVMETWDGWNELFGAAFGGFSNQVMENLDVDDELVAFYQIKTALYIAAHFGHVDLAVTMIRAGAKSDEAVGEHPTKAWAGKSARHVDTFKTPIHEAAEAGQLAVLRYFVHQDLCSVLARDGSNMTPLSVALRSKQLVCASFLVTKQWSKVPYGKKQAIAVTIFAHMRRWAEFARNRVTLIHGMASNKSSMTAAAGATRRRRHACVGVMATDGVDESTLVGHGVQLDGVTPSLLTSKPTAQLEY